LGILAGEQDVDRGNHCGRASLKISISTISSNRSVEFPQNDDSEPLSQSAKDWTVVHIRDDLGSIHNLMVLTNALLAAILGAILFH